MLLLHVFLSATIAFVAAQKEPYFVGNRTTIVHLFEWKWADITKECESFLGPKGFAGVQVSFKWPIFKMYFKSYTGMLIVRNRQIQNYYSK